MDIIKSLQHMVKTYEDNFGILFLTTLIACALSCLTLGILAGPLLGGLLLYNLRLYRGEKADFTAALREIFGHFEQTLPCILLSLLMGAACYISGTIGAIPVFGWLLNLTITPLLFFLYCLTLLFIMDKECDFIPALAQALGVILTNPLNIGLYGIIIGLLGIMGALFFVLPVVITIPFTFTGSTLAYYELASRSPEFSVINESKQLSRLTFINKNTLLVSGGLITLLFLIGIILRYGG